MQSRLRERSFIVDRRLRDRSFIIVITIRAALGMQRLGEGDADLLRRALAIDSLTPGLRHDLAKRLAIQTIS